MNPTAIYSKSGKGVQEAAGKTSLLKRPDRAVLSAIDGRATLADVAQKVGKSFDGEFEKLITQMDKDGFIREVSPGAAGAAKPGAKPAAKPASKPTAPMDAASDLDFSSFAPAPKPASAPSPKPAAAPPKPSPAAASSGNALNRAREEAEAKAAAEREKAKAEAEAKVRAEMEAKMRAEAEEKAKEAASSKGQAEAAAKLQAEADAKIKAARDAAVRAAAEAKAKADAESKRVREEAERARKEAEAKAEQARREAEEMKKRLEAERRQLEEERKRHEEEARKKEEERAERRRKEEEEEQARRAQREEEERKAEEEREARRKQREEEDRREEEERAARRAEQEERRRREEAESEAEEQARAAQRTSKAEAKAPEAPAPEAKPAAAKPAGAFDSLLSDLDSFGKKDDEDKKEKEEAERKAKAESAKRQAREEEERKEREEEEEKDRKRRAKEEAKRKEKEEEEAREREEEEAKERKRKEKEEAKRKEEEEAKAKEEEEEKKKKKEKTAKKKDDGDIPITDDDLSDGDVKRDQRELAKAARASPRPKEAPRVKLPPPVSGPSVRRKPTKWGKPVATVLFLLLAGGLGVAHVMPIDTGAYERVASEAFGQPVKIGSGRLWLFNGNLQLRLSGVTVGEGVKVASVHAFPTIGSLSDERKAFNRIELEGLSLPQEVAGGALFAKVKADNFSVARIVVKQLELTGRLAMPKSLEADIALDASGAPRAVTVRGPDALVVKLAPSGSSLDVEISAGGFAVPIAPEVAFSSFGLKGTATRQGMRVEKWDGTLLNGSITGTANVRWGGNWAVDGVFTMRGINAAVFAPALMSEGRGEGTARFQLSGADPSQLASSGRFEGNFTVNSGVLGSFDLNQALATGGKRASGRTPFNEMTGQAVYQGGALALRNVQIVAGSQGNMNAGASVDIAPGGALSGRIVADVRTPNQTLRATLNLGGTVRAPQIRN